MPMRASTTARCTPAATMGTRPCCGGGARVMIEDGLLEQFPMQAVFGMHNCLVFIMVEFSFLLVSVLGYRNEL